MQFELPPIGLDLQAAFCLFDQRCNRLRHSKVSRGCHPRSLKEGTIGCLSKGNYSRWPNKLEFLPKVLRCAGINDIIWRILVTILRDDCAFHTVD